MKKFTYLFVILFTFCNCSSDDGNDDPSNIAPGPFSVTILETRMEGANIEWTESIDIDGDAITYSIYLNDQLISTGGTALSYNFTGLDPETNYDGYIIADDGRGGTSQSDFFFVTEPETIILTINASDWIIDSFPEAGGTREIRGAGFEIPVYDDAISYQLEILDYTIVFNGDTISESGVYTWTNESQNSPVTVISGTGQYGLQLSLLSVNTTNSQYDVLIDYITSREGEAQVIISF